MHSDHRQRSVPEDRDDAVAHGVQVLDQVAFRGVGAIEQRVIVQADEGALSTLRGRRLGVLRRQLSGAVALDVSDAELDALTRDGNVLHVSGDLPVHADMAVTNKVTNAATTSP